MSAYGEAPGTMRGGPHEAPGPGTTPGPDAVPGAAVVRQRREVLYFALRDKRILLGAAVVLFFVVLAIVGPWIDPNDPQAFAGPTGQAPSADYWFGTTTFGQDVFAQFVNGLQATFLVGLLGGGLAALIGITIGFVAGYRGGIVDEVLNMITNIVLVIPTLVVLVVIAAFLSARGVLVEAAPPKAKWMFSVSPSSLIRPRRSSPCAAIAAAELSTGSKSLYGSAGLSR